MTFYPIDKLHNLQDGYRKRLFVKGKDLLLVEVEGRRFLLENRCPHAGNSLLEASIEDGKLQCPRHGIRFELDGGKQTDGSNHFPGSCLVFFTIGYQDDMVGVIL